MGIYNRGISINNSFVLIDPSALQLLLFILLMKNQPLPVEETPRGHLFTKTMIPLLSECRRILYICS